LALVPGLSVEYQLKISSTLLLIFILPKIVYKNFDRKTLHKTILRISLMLSKKIPHVKKENPLTYRIIAFSQSWILVK